MLLDDSLELMAIPPSNDAESIPMVKWHDIQLSDIWIPSKLLFNRHCFNEAISNEHKSVITHTFEKHYASDSLSVYSETEMHKSSFSSSEKLLDSLEEMPSKYLNTENTVLQNVTLQDRFQFLSNSRDTIEDEQEGKKDACLEENCDSSDNSIADYLEHLYISDNEGENPEDEPDKQKLSTSATNYLNDTKLLEACDYKSPEELVRDIYSKPDTCFSNNEVMREPEDLDTKPFPNSYQMIDPVELSDHFWNDIKLDSENISAKKEDYNFEDQTQDSGEWVNSEKSLKHNQSSNSLNEIANCSDEPVEVKIFPYLLQKSKDENAAIVSFNGKNNKKERKFKKKAPKNIPLHNFFLTKEEKPSSSPEYLDFYESLRQEHGYPNTSENYRPSASSVFPTLTEYNTVEESKILEVKSFDNTMNLMQDYPSFNCNEDTVIEDDDCLTKYVIENIPDFVDEEMLQDFILTYGDIKNLMIKQSGKKLKALIMMNVEDPNWIMECLNGTHPFGDLSDEGLKCYQIL